MRYILSVLCLSLLSGITLAGEYDFTVKQAPPVEFTVKPGQLPPVKAPVKAAPTEGRHSTTICEQHGCGCGCLRGGACLCHPGWEKSSGDWYFYRVRGKETGAFDSRSNTYWRKGNDGKWQEWVDDAPKQQSLAPVYRIRRSSSC